MLTLFIGPCIKRIKHGVLTLFGGFYRKIKRGDSVTRLPSGPQLLHRRFDLLIRDGVYLTIGDSFGVRSTFQLDPSLTTLVAQLIDLLNTIKASCLLFCSQFCHSYHLLSLVAKYIIIYNSNKSNTVFTKKIEQLHTYEESLMISTVYTLQKCKLLLRGRFSLKRALRFAHVRASRLNVRSSV